MFKQCRLYQMTPPLYLSKTNRCCRIIFTSAYFFILPEYFESANCWTFSKQEW